MRFPFFALFLAACSASPDPAADLRADTAVAPPDGAPACLSARTFFEEVAWGTVIGKVCLSCHVPDGLAPQAGAKLVLYPPSWPGFLELDLMAIREIAKVSYDGVPEILHKPLGELEHGGGPVLEAGSVEYAALTTLVSRLEDDACSDAPAVDPAQGVSLSSWAGTLRKAAIALVGRLPSDVEAAAVEAGGEPAFDATLQAMMGEEAFLTRVKEAFNDSLLTDRFLSWAGAGLYLLSKEQYPKVADLIDVEGACYSDDACRWPYNRAIDKEPLELIAHVVREDRPFTEVLTAPYTMVNPWSAELYGVKDASFETPRREDDWREASVTTADGIPIPHGGLLTTPAFLGRWPTTPTNRNRRRARTVLRLFLGTDLLRFAQRPVDPPLDPGGTNQVLFNKACSVCHDVMDPLAGAFQRWDVWTQGKYEPDEPWFSDMQPAGFDGEALPSAEAAAGLAWLGPRMAADPRFPRAVVGLTLKGLTGRVPPDFPDPAAADYDARRRGWQRQDAALGAIAEAFVASGWRFKALVLALVKSPLFRADGLDAPVDDAELPGFEGYGLVHLSTPEVLSRKIAAVTGVPWVMPWNKQVAWLTSSYRILYGGIDSDQVTERLAEPNAVLWNVARRMANDVACRAVPAELARPAAQRVLLPGVELTDLPTTDAAVAHIKAAIARLHSRVLGTTDEAEVERTWTLFHDVWADGLAAIAGGAEKSWLTGACQAHEDPLTGAPIDPPLTQDPAYVVRAWMAVLTYLLSDAEFLYE